MRERVTLIVHRNVPVPCPDNKPGCAVLHATREVRQIELSERETDLLASEPLYKLIRRVIKDGTDVQNHS